MRQGLRRLEGLQGTMARQMDQMAEQQLQMAEQMRQMAEQQRQMAQQQRQMAEAMLDLNRRFDTFLVRFEEVVEMLIQQDTEQLQRISSLEQESALLRERIEAIERRLAG